MTEPAKASAAKLQVIGVAPIKARLGAKWERLSALVHKLVETAIEDVRGPDDILVRLDELSYAVLFRNLSQETTSVVCIAVAKRVCEALFGAQVDEVAMRTIVAEILAPATTEASDFGRNIETLVERWGTENVVTRCADGAPPQPAVIRKPAQPVYSSPLELIAATHATLARFQMGAAFFPIWDIARHASNALQLCAFQLRGGLRIAIGRKAFNGFDPERRTEIEVSLLKCADAYAKLISEAGQVCSLFVGVSYETLTTFHRRIDYITALQKLEFQASSPIVLKLEDVPVGVPLVRLAELCAMLRACHARVTIDFQPLSALPEIDIALGATGLWTSASRGSSAKPFEGQLKRLVQVARAQKAASFLDQIDDAELRTAAESAGVRFGAGNSWHNPTFTGLEPMPHFPLTLRT